MAENGKSVALHAAPPTEAGVVLRELHFAHAWDVRGDPAQASLLDVARERFGIPLPIEPSSSQTRSDRTMLRLGPKTWLLLADTAPCEFARGRDALNAAGGALFDQSSSYVAWHVAGPGAARVLNRGSLLDLHGRAFPRGACTQTLFGHVNVIVWRPADAVAFAILVARSLGAHTWHQLCEAAESDRYAVAAPLTLRELIAGS